MEHCKVIVEHFYVI